MRRLLILVAATAIGSSMAMAQSANTASTQSDAAATSTGPTNGAVNSNGNMPSSVNVSGTINLVPPDQLAKGANSFTQGQAQARIESAGLSQVTDLHQDDQGIWRGKATKDGKTVSVGFDYKGDLSAQ